MPSVFSSHCQSWQSSDVSRHVQPVTTRTRVTLSPCHRVILSVLAAICVLCGASRAWSQSVPLAEAADRPIAAIRIEGLHRVDRQLVFNQLRSVVGGPLDLQTVTNDIRLLTRLGEFASIEALAELQSDGSVDLIYRVVEQPNIAEVQVVGNKVVPDDQLTAVIPLVRRGPRDNFAIQNSVRAIEDLYRKRGFYLTTVQVDESELAQSGVLLLRIIEGPRVRIRAIEFRGNTSFSARQLRGRVTTDTWIPFLRKGELNEDKLQDDVAKLDAFYKDRGYLDARVDRRIELSPDNREAKVVFQVIEGLPYILRSVRTERPNGQPLRVLHPMQAAAILTIKPGDIYRLDKLRESVKAIQEAYGVMGYVADARRDESWPLVEVRPEWVRVGQEPLVDLLLIIDEGHLTYVGLVHVRGNFLTKDKVIRREVRLDPSRPFDTTEVAKSKERIERTRLFNEVRVTLLEPQPLYLTMPPSPDGSAADAAAGARSPNGGGLGQGTGAEPAEPGATPTAGAGPEARPPQARDVLVEVKERNTGSVGFGVAVGTDSGVFGEVSLTQNNFDVADVPESVREFFSGRAFRGAGQQFNISIRPGTEISQYSISLVEPNVLDTNYALGGSTSYRFRQYEDFEEERLSFSARVGRRFGEVWDAGLSARVERIELGQISLFTPIEVFADRGPNTLTGLGLNVARTTAGAGARPAKGSRLAFNLEQVGAMGGDFTYTSASGEYTVFLTLDEDFLGRKSILKLTARAGYIFNGDEAPTYERFYLGGRTLRGFEFRTVSPKGTTIFGTTSDDPIGGQWMMFLGSQYEVPLFEEVVTGVVFLDSGTVTDEPGIDEYRLSVGVGIRLYIPQLGPTPIAFDFGYPLLIEETDGKQYLSFAAEFPF